MGSYEKEKIKSNDNERRDGWCGKILQKPPAAPLFTLEEYDAPGRGIVFFHIFTQNCAGSGPRTFGFEFLVFFQGCVDFSAEKDDDRGEVEPDHQGDDCSYGPVCCCVVSKII